MRDMVAGIRCLLGHELAILCQPHSFAVAEYRYRRRRMKSGEVGNEDHGAAANARRLRLWRPLALKHVVVEFWQAEEVQWRTEKRLMMIAAECVDTCP